MKNIIKKISIPAAALLLFIFSCENNELKEPPAGNTNKYPIFSLDSIYEISRENAVFNITLYDEGFLPVHEFGICWSTSPNPTTADKTVTSSTGTGSFRAEMTGLQENTSYYVRAYATNELGTSYGNEVSFVAENVVMDIDGNSYKWITIGDQVWMAENLATTHYNDGTAIPHVTGNSTWAGVSAPAYCWYDNNEATYKSKYGALYNWYVVETGKLCPTGWHMPTDDEWTQLEEYLIANRYNYDGSTSGDKTAKSLAATSGWISSSETGDIGNDMSSNNSAGFTALPGGYRGSNGSFGRLGYYGDWWSSSSNGSEKAWYRALWYDYETLGRLSCFRSNGFSVRCLQDD